MSTRKSSGALLATAAAVLFTSAPALDAVAADAKIKCDGGNACKGKGYVTLTKEECTAAQAANKPASKDKTKS